MVGTLRFGVVLPGSLPWGELVAHARALEGLGLDSVWLPDHVANPVAPDGPQLEPLVALAGLAGQTGRVRLGVLVLSTAFRNPMMLAKEVATLDHVVGGRLELGLEAGYDPRGDDHRMLGLPDWPPAERAARFGEATAIIDRLLRGRTVSHDGRHYRTTGALQRPLPVQQPRPRLTIAALGPTMLRTAVRFADAVNFGDTEGLTGAADAAATRERCEQLDAACLAVGRDPATLERSIFRVGRAPAAGPWASAEAFRDLVGRHAEHGVTEFLFFYPPPGPGSQAVFERVASDVLPALRAPVSTS